MAIHTFNNVSVFLISEFGEFIPVSSLENVVIDTSDYSDGVWGIFDGSLSRLDGDMNLWANEDSPNIFSATELNIWRDIDGAPVPGVYVVAGIKYSGAQQSPLEISVNDSIAGDGYLAVEASYAAIGTDRKVFWAFSDYEPVGPEPTAFWTNFVGSHEVP